MSSQHFGENLVHFQEVPERVVGLIHGNREMPHKCRLFLGFVNILTVAVVVGLAMEGTSPDGPQSQQQQDDDGKLLQFGWKFLDNGSHVQQYLELLCSNSELQFKMLVNSFSCCQLDLSANNLDGHNTSLDVPSSFLDQIETG